MRRRKKLPTSIFHEPDLPRFVDEALIEGCGEMPSFPRRVGNDYQRVWDVVYDGVS